MPKPTDYDKTHMRNMAAIGTRIDRIFKKAAEEAAKIGVSIKSPLPEDRIFSFDDYPETQKQIERLLTALKQSTEGIIVNGVQSAWTLSNNKNNALVSRIFGDRVGSLSKEQYKRYFSTNGAALEAFLQRKEQGLNLSNRVWRYTTAFKREIELGLDLGIRSGESAAKMTRSLRQYLQHPDKLFRRVRDKHGNFKLSKAAAEFHPGRGVYRSSYKNTRRLAATETNIAYRTSDHLRWQQMDFVVGIEIKLSNNHTLNGVPLTDICDTLAGRYPKDFKFTGWHPHCRCKAIAILKTEDEMAEDTSRLLDGQQPTKGSVNTVRDVPAAFKDWIEERKDRIEMGGNLPYFIKDNRKRVDAILGHEPEVTKSPFEIAKERHEARTPAQAAAIQQAWNERRIANIQQAIADGYLPKECAEGLSSLPQEQFNDRIAFLQKRAAKHASRTPEDIKRIQEAWNAKLKRDALIVKKATTVRDLGYNFGVDLDADLWQRLDKAIKNNNLNALSSLTKAVGADIKKQQLRLKALKDTGLLADLDKFYDGNGFTLSDFEAVQASIQKQLANFKVKGYGDFALDTDLANLQTLKKSLEYQATLAVKNKSKYATWEVAKESWLNLSYRAQDLIDLQPLKLQYNALLGFKTTSKDFKFYMDKAKEALAAGDVKTANHFITVAGNKKNSLEASRKPKGGKTATMASTTSKRFENLYDGGVPFTAAELAKIQKYESQMLDMVINSGFVSDSLNTEYHDYVYALCEKYYGKQKSLFSTAEQAAMKQTAEKYISRKSWNPHYVWGADVGNIYKGRYQKRHAYLKKLGQAAQDKGLTGDQLSIVQRFTNGSTFSNAYNLRHNSPYWARKWKEKMASLTAAEQAQMEQIIEEWSQSANFVLDRLVRYNGVTFRGLDGGGGAELRAQLLKAFNSGTAWVNEASCSTSMKYSVAKSFDGDLIMVIHNKTGAYIHQMSDYGSEFEVMTLRGAKYRVIKPPTLVNGQYIAMLEEI